MNFERGQDPKKAMSIGLNSKKHLCKKEIIKGRIEESTICDQKFLSSEEIQDILKNSLRYYKEGKDIMFNVNKINIDNPIDRWLPIGYISLKYLLEDSPDKYVLYDGNVYHLPKI